MRALIGITLYFFLVFTIMFWIGRMVKVFYDR